MEKRELLLQAALKVLAANGYHASSVADIAKEAKVSKALFYHYFQSKHDLLVIFAQRRLEEWTPLVENLETLKDPKERITFLIDFILDELEARSDWLRFLYMLYLSAEGVAAIEEAMQKYKDQFDRLFQAERKLYQDLGYPDPDDEATFLRSSLQGISLEYLLSGKNYPLKTMREKIIKRYCP
ncbi:MAG: TetR/AcrR family transcriptional regulator [Verrucomicrobia bacterium]|nr:TetR/AcrR family transcriptional regulator [Verrucomicrobiota bacterium]